MSEYIPPTYKENAFNCPHCGAFAHQSWTTTVVGLIEVAPGSNRQIHYPGLSGSRCARCGQYTIWFEATMVFPRAAIPPLASEDMPDEVAVEYNEAREVYGTSPKASAALLRLAVQHLCIHLGQPGRNINDDIGALVQAGLPVPIQQALDTVRVVGNNAVHPGTMNINDSPEIALALFRLLNIIVEDRITKPKQIAEMYAALPQGTLQAIERRDST